MGKVLSFSIISFILMCIFSAILSNYFPVNNNKNIDSLSIVDSDSICGITLEDTIYIKY